LKHNGVIVRHEGFPLLLRRFEGNARTTPEADVRSQPLSERVNDS
jgi:hypothetical protein